MTRIMWGWLCGQPRNTDLDSGMNFPCYGHVLSLSHEMAQLGRRRCGLRRAERLAKNGG